MFRNSIRNRFVRQRIVFISAIFIFCISVLSFILWQLNDSISFFYTPTQLKNLKHSDDGIIRVGGFVIDEPSSITCKKSVCYKFTVTDGENNLVLVFNGILPKMFRVKQGVVAMGKMDYENDIFHARQLLIKHDEKYKPPEIRSIELESQK